MTDTKTDSSDRDEGPGEGATPLDRALRVFGDVRAGESGTVLLMVGTLFFAFVSYYVIKVTREGLILASPGGAALKSYASALQAITLIFVVPLYSYFAARVDRRKLIRGVSVFFLGCIQLFVVGASVRMPYLGIVFYVWVGIFSLSIVSQFWSFANDIYNTDTGKRLFPIIAIAASVGSAAGSYLAKVMSDARLGNIVILETAAALLLLQSVLFELVFRRKEAADSKTPEPPKQGPFDLVLGGFAVIGRNRYIALIAVVLVLLNLVNSMGEFIVGQAADFSILPEMQRAAADGLNGEQLHDLKESLFRSLYGEYNLYVSVLSIGLQAFAASRIVKYFGIAGALFTLPFFSLGSYVTIGLGASFSVILILKIFENATDYSIANTGKALLWLPTSRDEKYRAKQAVDTFFVRLGDVLAALIVFVGTSVLSFDSDHYTAGELSNVLEIFSFTNVGLVLCWLAFTFFVVRANKKAELSADAERSSGQPTPRAGDKSSN